MNLTSPFIPGLGQQQQLFLHLLQPDLYTGWTHRSYCSEYQINACDTHDFPASDDSAFQIVEAI